MKSLHTCSLLAALLFSLGISAQTIHITGHYLDQQDAPIADALVTYYLFGEVFADSARSGSDGAFALQLTFTGIEETPPAGFLTAPAPNPFTGLCSFSIHSHSPATILVTDINGLHVDKRVLPQAGIYRCAWGGMNRIGQPQPAGTYVITVVGEGFVATRKVVFQGPATQRVTAEHLGEGSAALKQVLTDDRITFTRYNTSDLDIFLETPSSNTYLGIVTGNIGPQVTAPLTAEVHINNLEPWNLNLHFHNDDQSIYTVSDTDNFAIVSDSLLIFTGSQQALYQPVITATDPADPGLAAQLTANITIITEFQVEITGTYLDQQSNPIAEAEVTYMENGATPLSQTTTATNGHWSLAVLLNPNQVQDQLTFVKPHTTPLALTFDPPQADTTLGVVTGNIGPLALMPLDATVHVDDLAPWNLNLHFHNDDQSIYTVGNPNFAIEQDSLLVFTGTETGNYQFTITATDPQDATLTANTSANINISDQRIFTVSGSYADQQGEPIAGAMVDYWLDGDELLAQSFTQPDGAFTMQVTTGWAPGRSNDVLSFSKTNTSYLELAFATPQADTTFGVVTGNIGPTASGSIAETRFTIEGSLQWNLNDYFHNDDQSIYTLTGSDFSIVNQHWLQLADPAPGSYNTVITATDPLDAALTAQTTAAVEVQYTIDLPASFSIPEDSPQSMLFDAADYLNPNCNIPLEFSIVSQTNPQLIHLATQGSAVTISSLQPDGFGQSSAELRIENTLNGHAETLWFDVHVLPMTDVHGTVTDILDTTLIAGATVYIFSAELIANGVVITDTIAVLTTDENGAFHFQFEENPDTLTHYFVRIEKFAQAKGQSSYAPYNTWWSVGDNRQRHNRDIALIPGEQTTHAPRTRSNGSYTPRHTWLTVNSGGLNIEINYTIFLQNQIYELYNRTMRTTAGITSGEFPFEKRLTTRHWVSPPLIHLFNDTLYVPGHNIDVQFANLVYNAQNILPTFNPRDAFPENVVIHQSFGHMLQDNEMGAYFDNSISGAGVVYRIYAGPRMNKCSTAYRWHVGLTGPDNVVFNQELGSCFGAVLEPPQSPNYVSVFTDPSTASSYTSYDYEISKLYLDRNKIHYRNLTYAQSDSDGWDWEARPDIVEEWYSPSKKIVNTHMEIIVYGFKGEVLNKTIYAYDEIPSKVMEKNPMLFTREEIEQRRLEEAQGFIGQKIDYSAPFSADNNALPRGNALPRSEASGNVIRSLQSGRHNDFSTLFQ